MSDERLPGQGGAAGGRCRRAAAGLPGAELLEGGGELAVEVGFVADDAVEGVGGGEQAGVAGLFFALAPVCLVLALTCRRGGFAFADLGLELLDAGAGVCGHDGEER